MDVSILAQTKGVKCCRGSTCIFVYVPITVILQRHQQGCWFCTHMWVCEWGMCGGIAWQRWLVFLSSVSMHLVLSVLLKSATALHLPFLFAHCLYFSVATLQCPVAFALFLHPAAFTFILVKKYIYIKLIRKSQGPCLSVLSMSAYPFMSVSACLLYLSFSRAVSVCYWVAWHTVAPAAGQKDQTHTHTLTLHWSTLT